MTFNPNAAATENSGIFGLPYSFAEAKLVYLPVPWEATTSYGGGTSQGPTAILAASKQVDLFDADVLRPYEAGLFCEEISETVLEWNRDAKNAARAVIEVGGDLKNNPHLKKNLNHVNELSEKLNAWVFEKSEKILDQDKILAVIGGDHSVPFGAFQAIGKKFTSFGILHFDAHSDTRGAYEGFEHSHASIMHNALNKIPNLAKITQVGIRDFCEEEILFNQAQKNRIEVFFDKNLFTMKADGINWKKICEKIVATLPQNVWVSFDIDGLDPKLCPHTGTPVPGGLEFTEANFLLKTLATSGKKIIGFDLNEVTPGPDGDEWDANVGARLLYKLTGWTLLSQKICIENNL